MSDKALPATTQKTGLGDLNRIPTRYRITNPFVYVLGACVMLFSGAFWIPDSRMPKKPLKPKGEA